VLGPAPVAPADAEVATAMLDDSEQADAQSRDVLNGMMDLFQGGANPTVASASDAPRVAQAKKVPARTAAARPQGPRNLFDLIFGRNP
jgi:hypothetical protein